ncbi:MAG: ABC transporter ATP-binding protein [Myxococcota bacterium]
MHVELRGIVKRFGRTEALRGARLEIAPGEIHALLGENGAGKTTLVRVLYGSVRPDAGEVQIDGHPIRVESPRHALALGIGLVHQHSMLVPALSVAENLILGEPGSLREGRRRARSQLARYGLALDPDRRAGGLAVGVLQRLEIVRALSRGARLLVLDEPTAVLAPPEVRELLGLLAALRDDGHSVLFISHKLDEVRALCDRVTVLRRGRSVVTRDVSSVTGEELGRLMVGQAPPPPGKPPGVPPGPVALRLRGVQAGALRGLDLELRAGEVLGLAGVDGNGQASLEALLAGVLHPRVGTLARLREPVAVVPGDRQRTGLVLELSVAENLVLPEAAHGGGAPLFRYGLLRRHELREHTRATIERFAIQAEPGDPAGTLSGGNQQRLCLSRALARPPTVLVLVNPTRGLDVASAAAVRDQVRDEARRGAAVLLISTDLDEVLELADRIEVLFRGCLRRIEGVPRPSRERIGRLMLGEASP